MNDWSKEAHSLADAGIDFEQLFLRCSKAFFCSCLSWTNTHNSLHSCASSKVTSCIVSIIFLLFVYISGLHDTNVIAWAKGRKYIMWPVSSVFLISTHFSAFIPHTTHQSTPGAYSGDSVLAVQCNCRVPRHLLKSRTCSSYVSALYKTKDGRS